MKKELEEKLSGYEEQREVMKKELEERLSGYEERHSEAVRGIEGRTGGLKGEIQAFSERLENLDSRMQRQAFLDPRYFVFEDRFRGSSEDILARQRRYVQHFSQSQNVLDIGCGRGEFLDLLRENEIGGYGVDIHEDMVLFCQKKGLNVIENDAVAHLNAIDDKMLDGIFMAQVVEHLIPSDLITLISLAYRKMKFGTHIIIETINPLSIYAMVHNFCVDLSHIRPIPPRTLSFLLESYGFRDIAVEYFSPVSQELCLERVDDNSVSNEELRTVVRSYNNSVDKLNALVYAYQDYAIMARK